MVCQLTGILVLDTFSYIFHTAHNIDCAFVLRRVDGVPSLGWDDTISFLILPVLLVISQFVSMELMQPKTTDPAQQSSNLILKVLPIMIGWFALTVPAALSVYWFTNNIITTATSLYIRNSLQMEPPKTPGGAATMKAPDAIFSPSITREKPAGFGDVQTPVKRDEVKPITVMDAVIEDDEDDDDDDGKADETVSSDGSKKRRTGKKKKRKN